MGKPGGSLFNHWRYRQGTQRAIVPQGNAREGSKVPGVEALAAAHLSEVAGRLVGKVLGRAGEPQAVLLDAGAARSPISAAGQRGQLERRADVHPAVYLTTSRCQFRRGAGVSSGEAPGGILEVALETVD